MNLVISLLAVLATLGLLEIGMRLLTPGPVLIGFDSLWLPDPVLGWRLKPDNDVSVWTAGTLVRVSTNSHGWRDVEHTVAKPEGVFRILVLGDSFMEGDAVSDEDTFARQLETVARQDGLENVDVINMSVSGYGTLQSYLAYVEEGMSYSPDLVLLGFFNGNGRALSVLARVLATYWAEQEKADPTGDGAAPGDEFWADPDLCEEAPLFTEGWAVTKRILVELDDAVRESGAQLVVFTVPAREETDSEYSQQVVHTLEELNILCLEKGESNRQALGVLEGSGIPVVDLLPSFRVALNEEGRELYARDNHWNAEGYALAAEEVFEALSAQGFLPAY
ncbi:MAG: SGNH/GDSL hydrolase family protein [Chloroflexota bacterium]